MENGSNGHPPIGNSLSRISEHDFSSRRGASCWNLIHDQTVPRFLRMNCALSLSRKAREFSVGKRCLQPIQINARGLNKIGSFASRDPTLYRQAYRLLMIALQSMRLS